MLKSFASICSFFLIVLTINAQETGISNWRVKNITLDSLVQELDSLSIVPESLTVFDEDSGEQIPESSYNIQNNRIIWREGMEIDSTRNLNFRFRVLPFSLGQNISHLDTTKIRKAEDGTYIGFDYSPHATSNGLIDFKGLDYNGSFARSISFGNNQNLVLNSSFNLQLAGNLGDDVEILAAISDNNIPLQPEGNTQQLQEFDKIFIQLKKKTHTLIAGDYELARPNSYFMNYYKKLQGASYKNDTELFGKGRLKSSASIAVARGKFARNIIAQQEGNQGPYKLRGGEGETFIIVLAGTEKVFLDGTLLTRGLEEDYVIDYNQGEVTFTNKILITKDTRIIVEFEYADQNYLRSMYAAGTEYEQENLRLYFNYYSEQDSKNSTAQDELSEEAIQAFKNAGDNADSIFVSPAIDTLAEGFNENFVMYKLIDTIYNGQFFSNILVYTTNADSAQFVANFLNVGIGNGDYNLIPSNANGRVFEWSPPDENGLFTGSYRNVQKLVAPNQQQMYTLGAEFDLNKRSSILTEVAMSKNDPNRFSELDKDNDIGLAVFSKWRNEILLDNKERGWRLKNNVSYEFKQDNFKALNPYRTAEFTRDWNSSAITDIVESEHIGSAGIEISKAGLARISYDFSGFLKGEIYDGIKHQIKAQLNYAGFNVLFDGSLLNSNTVEESSNFFRPKLDISKTFKALNDWKIGVYGEREKNNRQDVIADTLRQTSFYYDLYKVYIESPQNEKFGVKANYTQRYDYAPETNDFAETTIADNVNFTGFWNQKKSGQLSWNLNYRNLKISREDLTNENAQETYLGRIDYALNLFKRSIRSNTSYEIGSGQQPKLEEYYIPVNPGEGVYRWNNLNGDDVVQRDEVQIAAFQSEADLIKLTRTTNEFIRTNNVSLNQSLRLDPRPIWYNKKGGLKFLSRFSTQSTFRITRRTLETADVASWNPFQLNIADSTLVSVNSLIRNALYFNRSNPTYDLEVGQSNNRNKRILTSGYESAKNQEYFFRVRWNISKKLSTIVRLARSIEENDIELFDTRDYEIYGYQIEPQLTYLPYKNVRAIVSYKHEQKENRLNDPMEMALINDINLELTFNQASKSSIRSKISFVNITYDGLPNTAIEFSMLEGLKNGKNYLWNIRYDRTIAKNIQLGFSYEGRKTGDVDIIHTGSAQLRATF